MFCRKPNENMSFFTNKTVTGCAAKDPCASDGAELWSV